MFSWLFSHFRFTAFYWIACFSLIYVSKQMRTNQLKSHKKFNYKLEFDLHQHDALSTNKERKKEKFSRQDLWCWSNIFRSLHVTNKQVDLHHLSSRRPMHFSPITINLRCRSSANFCSLISLSPSKAHNRKFVSISVESFLYLNLN